MLTHLYEDFHYLLVKVWISPYRSQKKKAANHCGLAVYRIRKSNTVFHRIPPIETFLANYILFQVTSLTIAF